MNNDGRASLETELTFINMYAVVITLAATGAGVLYFAIRPSGYVAIFVGLAWLLVAAFFAGYIYCLRKRKKCSEEMTKQQRVRTINEEDPQVKVEGAVRRPGAEEGKSDHGVGAKEVMKGK